MSLQISDKETKLTHMRGIIPLYMLDFNIIVFFVPCRSFNDTKCIPLQLHFDSICQNL